MSDKPCAIPIVKGFKIAPAKPNPAATKTSETPTIESYPILIAKGTKIMVKAIVSSLMPKTAPKVLNISIIKVKIRLSTPINFTNLNFSSFLEYFKNERIPTSIALLSFIIQKAPPISKINAIMFDVFTKPSKRAEKICHVCAELSVN